MSCARDSKVSIRDVANPCSRASTGMNARGNQSLQTPGTEPEATPEGSPPGLTDTEQEGHEFCLQVRNRLLHTALSAVGEAAGWTVRRSIGPGTLVVIDAEPLHQATGAIGANVALVVERTPFATKRGLQLLSRGVVLGLFCEDEPRDLIHVLQGLRHGRATTPRSVFDMASHMPEIGERREEVIAGLAGGHSIRDISSALHISEASVKRDLSEVYAILDVSDRAALVARAHQLGIRPSPPGTTGGR